jgi:hypothetical protein
MTVFDGDLFCTCLEFVNRSHFQGPRVIFQHFAVYLGLCNFSDDQLDLGSVLDNWIPLIVEEFNTSNPSTCIH